MKIEIEEQENLPELLVKILCEEKNTDVDHLYHYIAKYTQPVWVTKNNVRCKLWENQIYYIDTVEGNTFYYTKEDVYETNDSLSKAAANLKGKQFVRISKNCIINTDYLIRVELYENHRLLAIMKNEEKLIVGRAYISELKRVIKEGR